MKDKAYTHEKEYYYSIIRKNIKKLRKEKGYTQQDLADMTELSREYICDIENEKRGKHLTIEVLGRLLVLKYISFLRSDYSFFVVVYFL